MANLACQLETVDHRHAYVQEGDVGHTLLDFRQSVRGAVGNANVMAKQGQELAE